MVFRGAGAGCPGDGLEQDAPATIGYAGRAGAEGIRQAIGLRIAHEKGGV